MSALVIVALFAILLVLFGALLGAELQDRRYEGERRRLAEQRRELNARWWALRNRGAAVDVTVPGHNVILPLVVDPTTRTDGQQMSQQAAPGIRRPDKSDETALPNGHGYQRR